MAVQQSRLVTAGFAFIAFGGVLALWGIGAGQDEPGLFGALASGIGLFAVLGGVFRSA